VWLTYSFVTTFSMKCRSRNKEIFVLGAAIARFVTTNVLLQPVTCTAVALCGHSVTSVKQIHKRHKLTVPKLVSMTVCTDRFDSNFFGRCFRVVKFLDLMKATFDCGGNTRQWSAGVRRQERNSLDSRKEDFLKLMTQSSRPFMRDTRLDCLWVMIYFARIKRPDLWKFFEVVLKLVKYGAIRFLRRVGLALRSRTTIRQKLPEDCEQKLLNYQR